MDTNELRRLAAEVDEEHREAMKTFADEVGDQVFGADAATRSRRGFLRGVGLGGALAGVTAAGVVVPALAAAAQSSSTTTPSDAGSSSPSTPAPATTTLATTTTAAPQRPTTADLVLLGFAQSLELAAVAAYGVAIESKKLMTVVIDVAIAFQSHHRQHAQAFAGLSGRSAPGIANEAILAVFGPKLQAAQDQATLLKIAYDLENAAAATYTLALGLLQGTNGASLVSQIQPIESRHAVVLGQVLGLPLDQYVPSFQTTEAAVTPDKFPIQEK